MGSLEPPGDQCGQTGEVKSYRRPHSSESPVCTWIECSHDKRYWAEVQEEEQRERVDGVLRPLHALTPSSSKISADTQAPEITINPRQKTGPSLGGTASKENSIYDVCEVFSPPRICAAATEHGLRGGWPIDMAVCEPNTKRRFDLRGRKDQSEVKRLIRRDCPTMVVVSPPCTAFSIANQGEVDEQTLKAAVEMIRFSIEICELQHKSGRHFIFEQPQSSRAWSLNEVVNMMYCDGVTKTTCHQCMYGLVSSDHQGVAPAYKPTSVLTNHPALAEVLQKRRSGDHRHAQLIGKGACSRAACYPMGSLQRIGEGDSSSQEKT